jgi:hypothetical protein
MGILVPGLPVVPGRRWTELELSQDIDRGKVVPPGIADAEAQRSGQ